jgi:hypothetical protein
MISTHENWNDPYFVGLDRIEFFDLSGELIDIGECGGGIMALPHSTRILDSNNNSSGELDPRTPRKLIKTKSLTNNTSWLAPLSRCMTEQERLRSGGDQVPNNYSSVSCHFPPNNTLFIMFPYPVAISYIKIYNYSKTPARGIKEFSLYADHRLVYMGLIKSG